MLLIPCRQRLPLKASKFPWPLSLAVTSRRVWILFKMAEKAEKAPVEPEAHAAATYPEETLKDAGDVEIQSLTPEEDKRILRRIDL